jgi:hypothetical protein
MPKKRICPFCKRTKVLKNYPYAGNDGLPGDVTCFYCDDDGMFTYYTESDLQQAREEMKEKCAKLCEKIEDPQISIPDIPHSKSQVITMAASQKCAQAIRQMEEKP